MKYLPSVLLVIVTVTAACAQYSEYLPPLQNPSEHADVALNNEYLAPAVEEPSALLADDGYQYKTVRRFRNRNRRDVDVQYLPPHEELFQPDGAPSNEYLAPVFEEPSALLADDGYRYKTVKTLKVRRH